MPDDLVTEQLMTRSFFETLHPLLRRLNAERTISPGKMGVLRHLAEKGRATTSELAIVGQVSPQGISLAARELERSQFVVRVPDAGCRMPRIVAGSGSNSPTPGGRSLPRSPRPVTDGLTGQLQSG
jgi:hypothetical protein